MLSQPLRRLRDLCRRQRGPTRVTIELKLEEGMNSMVYSATRVSWCLRFSWRDAQ